MKELFEKWRKHINEPQDEVLKERFDPLGLFGDDDQERAADAAQKAARDIDATRYDTDKYGDMPGAELGAKKGAIHSRPSGKHPNINPGAKKKPAPKPKRKIASGKMRQEINQMLKSGKIDKETWRKARRALYKSTDAAQAVLDAAGKKNTGPDIPGAAGATTGQAGGLTQKRAPESPALEEELDENIANLVKKGGSELRKKVKRAGTKAADALSKVFGPDSDRPKRTRRGPSAADKERASKEAAKAARDKSNERPTRTRRSKSKTGTPAPSRGASASDKARASKEAEKASRGKDRKTSHGGADTAAAKAEKDARAADRKKRPQNKLGNVAKENFERTIKDLIYEVLEEEGFNNLTEFSMLDPLGQLEPDAAADRERAKDLAKDTAIAQDRVKNPQDAFGDIPGAKPPKPSPTPKPKRKIASDKMRKQINQYFKSGKIDKATWRKARRALYKSAEAAQAILDAAGKERQDKTGYDLKGRTPGKDSKDPKFIAMQAKQNPNTYLANALTDPALKEKYKQKVTQMMRSPGITKKYSNAMQARAAVIKAINAELAKTGTLK